MTVAEAVTGQVVCLDCGTQREVSETTLRRIRNHEPGASSRCWSCRRTDPCERNRRWWLRWAGIPEADIVHAGGTAGWVRANGLPEVLWEMASSVSEMLIRDAA